MHRLCGRAGPQLRSSKSEIERVREREQGRQLEYTGKEGRQAECTRKEAGRAHSKRGRHRVCAKEGRQRPPVKEAGSPFPRPAVLPVRLSARSPRTLECRHRGPMGALGVLEVGEGPHLNITKNILRKKKKKLFPYNFDYSSRPL